MFRGSLLGPPSSTLKVVTTQIIFVSSDSEVDEFNEYFEEMPWTAVPYDSDEVRF